MLAPPPPLALMGSSGALAATAIPESLSVASAGAISIGSATGATGATGASGANGTTSTTTGTAVTGVGIGPVSGRGYSERPETLAAVLRYAWSDGQALKG